MAIDDTITVLTKIYQTIDRGIPKTAASPNALVSHLNDLYSESTKGFASMELFMYDDIGRPSITLTVQIDMEFDSKIVMERMQKKLKATPHEEADEIGKKGVVWSYERYDFVYDDNLGQLRISHQYSHRRRDTQSVLSIIKKMLGYAKDYLEEVKKSVKGDTTTPETYN